MSQIQYISLGSTCSVAIQGQQLNKRTQAYPFDWVRTDDFDSINKAIENNFDKYISSVVRVSESDKFPFMKDDVFPLIVTTDKSIIMKNQYDIIFYHDFAEKNTMDDVDQKYQRRILRFFNIIKSNNKICFIRDEIKPSKLSIHQIERFIELIFKINNTCQLQLIIIIHNPRNKKYDILDYKNNNIMIINDTNKFGDWTRPNVDWKTIFQ